MTALGRSLFGRRARLRWIHLILGGALAMPYVLVGSVVVGPLAGGENVFGSLSLQLASFALGLPLAAVTSLFPLTRPLESGVVRSLCGVGAERLAYGPARTKGEKGRTAAWFTLHLGAGGIVAGMSLAVPPFAVTLIVLPFVPVLRDGWPGLPGLFGHAWALVLSPLAGAAMLLALAGCAAAVGALLARWAPALLGPS
ncbi:histidine kinase, partial [Streptomyces sp. SID10362]|nr:histidine kinase [Streptomyces sp. SID10362]